MESPLLMTDTIWEKLALFNCLKSIEVTEKIAAETAGREAAVKAKEKIEGKYEDLKKKSQEKLAEQSTGSEALQSQIDGLKQLSNKMEEEIENNKIQKMKDDKKLEEIERVGLKKYRGMPFYPFLILGTSREGIEMSSIGRDAR